MSKYYIIFDTNILYRRYDKHGDFNEFSFSSTFQNVIDIVNEFDLYEYVTIVIPSVVWSEMIEQEIESHDTKLKELFEICKKECENTYYIQTLDDLDPGQFRSIDNVGITAGASTPNNIIEEVQKNVRSKR